MTAARGLRIGEDGSRSPVERSELADLYEALGCRSVEVVSLDTPAGLVDLWIDGEGLLVGREPNPTATALARHYGAIWADSVLRGPVVALQVSPQGETVSLSAEAEAELLRVLDGDPGPDRYAPTLMEAAAEAVLEGIPVIVVESPGDESTR